MKALAQEVFEPFRIQIIGKAEHRYLSEMTEEQRYSRLGEFFKMKKGEIEIELSSDDAEFVEQQLAKWREEILKNRN